MTFFNKERNFRYRLNDLSETRPFIKTTGTPALFNSKKRFGQNSDSMEKKKSGRILFRAGRMKRGKSNGRSETSEMPGIFPASRSPVFVKVERNIPEWGKRLRSPAAKVLATFTSPTEAAWIQKRLFPAAMGGLASGKGRSRWANPSHIFFLF
jgi:hypothetical protein